jgi:hypothetical protein
MKFLERFSTERQSAISHIFLRILCLSLVENECARLIQEASGRPAVAGNYILTALFALGLLLAIANIKWGYIIGMSAGAINIIAKIFIVITGHEFWPHRPYLWIIQSLMVIYFCYKAYQKRGEEE